MPSFSRTRTEAEFSVSHHAQILKSLNWSKPNERRALPTSVAYPLPQDPLLRKYPMYACPIILARSSLLSGSVTRHTQSPTSAPLSFRVTANRKYLRGLETCPARAILTRFLTPSSLTSPRGMYRVTSGSDQ